MNLTSNNIQIEVPPLGQLALRRETIWKLKYDSLSNEIRREAQSIVANGQQNAKKKRFVFLNLALT